MSTDNKFINGLIVKAPNDNAPDYVKAKLSIKREELIGWLESESGEWINADIKVSQQGKWYAAVDTWKPNGGASGAKGGAPQRERPQKATNPEPAGLDDDIPFVTNRSTF